jgi:hypothetical protein
MPFYEFIKKIIHASPKQFAFDNILVSCSFFNYQKIFLKEYVSILILIFESLRIYFSVIKFSSQKVTTLNFVILKSDRVIDI